MNKKSNNICVTCIKECSLRSERILYCDSFKGQDGVRLMRKRLTNKHGLDSINHPDMGPDSPYGRE